MEWIINNITTKVALHYFFFIPICGYIFVRQVNEILIAYQYSVFYPNHNNPCPFQKMKQITYTISDYPKYKAVEGRVCNVSMSDYMYFLLIKICLAHHIICNGKKYSYNELGGIKPRQLHKYLLTISLKILYQPVCREVEGILAFIVAKDNMQLYTDK